MLVGITKRLRSPKGGLGMVFGIRLTAKTAIFLIWVWLVYWISYYAIWASIWFIVAICYVCFVLPVKLIMKAVKGGDKQAASPAPNTQPQPTPQATMPKVTMKSGGRTFVDGKLQHSDVALSSDEQTAVDIIFNELSKNGVDTNVIHFERTQEYLKIVGYKHFTFCQLALNGAAKQFSLTVQGKDQKALDDDCRFVNMDIKKGRYFRIPIDYTDDIRLYTDLIYPAFTVFSLILPCGFWWFFGSISGVPCIPVTLLN